MEIRHLTGQQQCDIFKKKKNPEFLQGIHMQKPQPRSLPSSLKDLPAG